MENCIVRKHWGRLGTNGEKVLLIDGDPQGDLTISLGVEEPDEIEYSLATLMLNTVKGDKKITAATVGKIDKLLGSCFKQAVKWGMMEKNLTTDATVPKYKAEEREIWTADMLMKAIDACDNKWLKVAFHLAFTATLRIGELLGLTWDCVDISEEAIAHNAAYVIVNKEIERVSKKQSNS